MLEEEELIELRKAKQKEKEQGLEAKNARKVEKFEMLLVEQPAAKGKAAKKATTAAKGKAKTVKAKPKGKKGKKWKR